MKQSDGFDREHASRLAMEQAAKHQEELERAVQAQVSASADAIQSETEALEKFKQLELKYNQELGQIGAMKGMLAEKEIDLSEANETNTYLESQVSELTNEIRTLEDTLKERTFVLQERIELFTNLELEKESLVQEVRSCLEEKDRLSNQINEFESLVKQNLYEKETSQQAYSELEKELLKLRESATVSRRQHTSDQDKWSSEKQDLLNKLSEIEANCNGYMTKFENQIQANEAFKEASQVEKDQLIQSYELQIESLQKELEIMKSDFEEYKNSSSDDVGIVGKEVASKETVLRLQVTLRDCHVLLYAIWVISVGFMSNAHFM